MTRILVIKLGALGDMILAAPFFKAIREHHREARISLLTTRPYAGLVAQSGWADEVLLDPRAPWWRPWETARLLWGLRQTGFTRCYDLQGNRRTRLYYRRMRRPGLEWVGNAPGCSHFHPDYAGIRHLSVHRRKQLALAGITAIALPDLDFLHAEVAGFGLPDDYTLLIPGGAPHRPEKRWPCQYYVDLAQRLCAGGSTPVLLGARAESETLAQIALSDTRIVNLGGRTSLAEIATLARNARAAIGNDTGPMHIAAAVNCPSLIVYGAASDPAHIRPWGERVAVLTSPILANLGVEEVWQAYEQLLTPDRPPTPRPDTRETAAW